MAPGIVRVVKPDVVPEQGTTQATMAEAVMQKGLGASTPPNER